MIDNDAGGTEDKEDSERSARWVPSAVCMRGGIHQHCYRVLSAHLTCSVTHIFISFSKCAVGIYRQGKGKVRNCLFGFSGCGRVMMILRHF